MRLASRALWGFFSFQHVIPTIVMPLNGFGNVKQWRVDFNINTFLNNWPLKHIFSTFLGFPNIRQVPTITLILALKHVFEHVISKFRNLSKRLNKPLGSNRYFAMFPRDTKYCGIPRFANIFFLGSEYSSCSKYNFKLPADCLQVKN